MLDYCGEEEFYPYDGDNDNYNLYEPNLGGVEVVRKHKKSSRPFITNHGYYDNWVWFDRVIERDTCYSILRNNIWMNIPKKIVREVKVTKMLVYLPIFSKICTTALEKAHGIGVDDE